jgi:Zn-dependent M28 family amino/carboxypeptidase
VKISGRGKACALDLADDAVIWTKRVQDRVDIVRAPLVFLGYGVVAPDKSWNDYAGIDMRGKVAVVLANDPDHEAAAGPFEGPSMTYYGRLSYKAAEASRQGALAVLVINHPQFSGYGWPVLQSAYGAPALDIERAGEARVSLEGWLKLEAAERLFACAGRDLEKERQAAGVQGFKAHALPRVSLDAQLKVKVEPSETHNVVARVAGREKPDETFVFTAHWDHLGIGKPDSTGDPIYNGAMDNAAGVGGLIELARAFAAGVRPRRSLLFIATTIEESGLLGSEYYASRPLHVPEKTVGGINMDAVNVFGPTPTMEVTGMGKTTLEDTLSRELEKTGRRMRDDPNSVVGFYYRSDHFPFAKRGVPFVFAGSGWELAEEKAPNIRDPQVGTRFQQPSDEWWPEMDFAAAARDMRIYYAVARALVDSAEWPEWRPGAEFKSIRDASAAARR